jgi:hypothetical protein
MNVAQDNIKSRETLAAEFSSKLRRRSFTWFNYTDVDVDYIMSIPASKADYLCFGFEVTEDGKQHLQGYMEVGTPISGSAMVLRLTRSKAKNPGLTVLKLIKDNRDVQINYCRKEDTTDQEAVDKWGSKFFECTNKARNQGERTDWHKLHEMCKDGKTFGEIAESYPEHAIKYHGGIDRLLRASKQEASTAEFVAKYETAVLRPWQERLAKELSFAADDRKIIWVYDTKGNMGKSWFSHWLEASKGATRFENGATRDVAHIWQGAPIAVFDFSRTVEGRLNYGVLESLKNGSIMSTKYDSCIKHFGTPHVVCFANWPPNREAMSADRWSIRCLDASEDVPENIEVAEAIDVSMCDLGQPGIIGVAEASEHILLPPVRTVAMGEPSSDLPGKLPRNNVINDESAAWSPIWTEADDNIANDEDDEIVLNI